MPHLTLAALFTGLQCELNSAADLVKVKTRIRNAFISLTLVVMGNTWQGLERSSCFEPIKLDGSKTASDVTVNFMRRSTWSLHGLNVSSVLG
jgi:hypothetical protein